MKKVLIFGANGFAGNYLADEFLAHGYDVYGCSRNGRLTDGKFAGVYLCDLLDTERVKAVICEVKPDYIINMAGISSVGLSWKIPQLVVETNVTGPLNIIEAVYSNDIRAKILFIGSAEEYAQQKRPIREDDPLGANNPYGVSKVMLERYCDLYRNSYRMEVSYVRTFNHTGVGQMDTFVIPSWCKQVAEIEKSGKPGEMRVGNIEVQRDFSDVRDVARAYRMVLENGDPQEIYNIGSGKSTSLRGILEHMISLSSQEVTLNVQQELIRPLENDYMCADCSKIEQAIGWKAEIDLKDTIQEMYEHYLKKKR